MPTVKSTFKLDVTKLTVAPNLNEPHIRAAGLAWLQTALELFQEEVFSIFELEWNRTPRGECQLTISLDSSMNVHTRPMLALAGAPPIIYERRERFDEAMRRLMSRTTPEDLWLALANQRLAYIWVYDINTAWENCAGETARRTRYPTFSSPENFLFYLMSTRKDAYHPWL